MAIGKSCRKHITSYRFKIPYIRLVLTLPEFYTFPRASLTLQGLLNIKMQLKSFLSCQTFQYIASILNFLQDLGTSCFSYLKVIFYFILWRTIPWTFGPKISHFSNELYIELMANQFTLPSYIEVDS